MLPLGVLYCFLTILVLSIVFIAIHNSCRLTNPIHYDRTLDLTMLRTNNPKVYNVLPQNTSENFVYAIEAVFYLGSSKRVLKCL